MGSDSLEQWKVEMEHYKCELEKWKTEMHHNAVVYQEVNMQGQAAMKAALLINGGASIAMLAFIGTAMNNYTESPLLLKLCFSMLMFIAGVLNVAFAFGVTYLAGFADSKEKVKLWAILNTISILLVIIGYILFALGSLTAYCAFTNSLSSRCF